MRWDDLFDDLESQLEGELSAEEVDLEAEEERLRLGRLSVRERLLAVHEVHDPAAGYALRVVLTTGVVVTLRPATFGKDWMSATVLEAPPGRNQCLVPFAAVAGIELTRAQVAASLHASTDRSNALAAKLGLPFVLRDLCRRRTPVDVVTAAGIVHGTIDRVGRDHLDLAAHESGSARRERNVAHYRLVPLEALVLLRF